MENRIIFAAFLLIAATATVDAQVDLAYTALPHTQTHRLADKKTGIGATPTADVTPSFTRLSDKSVLFVWTENGARYKTFFSENGAWLHTVVSYEGNLLSATVKGMIRSAYRDLPISYVDEIRSPGQRTVYRVQLQDEKRLVIVKVSGDEIEVEAEYCQ